MARVTHWGSWMLVWMVFAISYTQLPLYSSNQNTYFLHGLAQAKVGLLDQDVLATTSDPAPVFSFIVANTVRLLSPQMFHIYHVFLVAIYVYSILGITMSSFPKRLFFLGFPTRTSDQSRVGRGTPTTDPALPAFRQLADSIDRTLSTSWRTEDTPSTGLGRRSCRQYHLSRFATKAGEKSGLALFLVLTALHSPAAPGFLFSGLAGYSILGTTLQPSAFGVLLLLSACWYLRGHLFRSVVCAALTAALHPIYLLSAIILIGTYMVLSARERGGWKEVLGEGAAGLAIMAPIVAYVILVFSPSSLEAAQQAREILVTYRMPHHTMPTIWWGPSAGIQIGIVLTALLLTKGTRICAILFVLLVVSTVLTIVQILTGSNVLAMLLPWRPFVFLVPVSTALFVGRGVLFLVGRLERFRTSRYAIFVVIVTALLVAPVAAGVAHMQRQFREARRNPLNGVMDFVAAAKKRDQLYLIPIGMETFRLRTGAPVFVDKKSHPYKDTEVLEWYGRIQSANAFYWARGDSACRLLGELSVRYGVTHVVLGRDRSKVACDLLHELYRDPWFGVYELVPPRKS